MIHIKLFENYNLGEIDLIKVDDSPSYKAFDIYLNNNKVGIIDVGLYKEDLNSGEAEIVAIKINQEHRGFGIGKIAVNRLFEEFPHIKSFIVMPTIESMDFWKSIGANLYKESYLIIHRN